MARPLVPPGPLADAGRRTAEHRAWYFYDWANSGFVTTTGAVLFGPYLTAIAETAACGQPGTPEEPCRGTLDVLGIPVAAGSVAPYAVTFATLLSAMSLPIVGAIADRTSRKRHMLAGFAWSGPRARRRCSSVAGSNWVLGIVLMFVASLFLGASLVVNDAILCEIAGPIERDQVSSRGWALGYLGGGLLLAANLVLVTVLPFGLSRADAVRVSLLAPASGGGCGRWCLSGACGTGRLSPPWRPGRGGTARGRVRAAPPDAQACAVYPMTLTFLVAYLFYNDGIQTVIYAASMYGEKAAGLREGTVLIAAILVVQFVAFGGALLFGRVPAAPGQGGRSWPALVLWTGGRWPDLPAGEDVVLFLRARGASAWCSAAPRRCPGHSSACSSPVARRVSTSASTRPQSGARAGSAPWLRPGIPAHGLLPQRDPRADHVLRRGLVLLSRVDVQRGIQKAGNEVPAVSEDVSDIRSTVTWAELECMEQPRCLRALSR